MARSVLSPQIKPELRVTRVDVPRRPTVPRSYHTGHRGQQKPSCQTLDPAAVIAKRAQLGLALNIKGCSSFATIRPRCFW